MRCSATRWFGLLLTLFLVLVLPSCWYGTLQRAVAASDIPANSNEEERDEHRDEATSHDEMARRSAPPPAVDDPAPLVREAPRAHSQRGVRVASVAGPVHPSLYSVRRQQ